MGECTIQFLELMPRMDGCFVLSYMLSSLMGFHLWGSMIPELRSSIIVKHSTHLFQICCSQGFLDTMWQLHLARRLAVQHRLLTASYMKNLQHRFAQLFQIHFHGVNLIVPRKYTLSLLIGNLTLWIPTGNDWSARCKQYFELIS